MNHHFDDPDRFNGSRCSWILPRRGSVHSRKPTSIGHAHRPRRSLPRTEIAFGPVLRFALSW